MTFIVNVTDLAIRPRCDLANDIEIDEEDEVTAVAVVDAEFS